MTSDRPDDPDYAAQGIETLTKCVTPSKRQRRMEERPAPPRVLKEHELMFDLTGTSELRKKKEPKRLDLLLICTKCRLQLMHSHVDM
jgi:hypothetical protein